MSVTETSRLTTLQAAMVIARRDFFAILFSRAFLFFLLGPLFPIVVGGLAGGIGSQVQQETGQVEVGLIMDDADARKMLDAELLLDKQSALPMPPMVAIEGAMREADPAIILREKRGNFAAIISGTPEKPQLTATPGQLKRLQGPVGLLAATAMQTSPSQFPEVATVEVASSGANVKRNRVQTAQAGQMLLFLLTMLLGGMVLSNLVEEKGNKIIEVLAAAIPMDAVFLGKLFAMLGVSFVGIAVWGAVGGLVVWAGGGLGASFAAPAVGWPLFLLLAVIYFAMGYLILGSLFLAIGSMAATVREVQTLSMPVTMMQLLVFFFASYALTSPGSTIEIAAIIVPFSSPFAMLARAAQSPEIWPHFLAIAWQALAVAVFVKLGASLFKRRVMKSGPRNKTKSKRSFFRKRAH